MVSKKENRDKKILEYVARNPEQTSSSIKEGASLEESLVTVKRSLANLVANNRLCQVSSGKYTRYLINPAYELFRPINVDSYFADEIDNRTIKKRFNLDLIEGSLSQADLFTKAESEKLRGLQRIFTDNIESMSSTLRNKGFETLAIDLSWKSSEIEGNTYSLLETEQLLKEAKQAKGKKQEEAAMLLNHKRAIDYIMEDPGHINPLSRAKIEEIHLELTAGLGMPPGLRTRGVSIGGTNYRPLDNEFQIRESIESLCKVINERDDVFEKALIALFLISYIQPFEDGNKRTARLLSNALLIADKHCPLSFRTVDSQDYKKAMLIFYEQNSIIPVKEIFIDQYDFAVHTYFG